MPLYPGKGGGGGEAHVDIEHNTFLSYDSGFQSDATHGLRRCTEDEACWKLSRAVIKMNTGDENLHFKYYIIWQNQP